MENRPLLHRESWRNTTPRLSEPTLQVERPSLRAKFRALRAQARAEGEPGLIVGAGIVAAGVAMVVCFLKLWEIVL